MKIVVKKFGGTSVADINCIKNVAEKVANQFQENKKLVVVVSAMSGTTDNLVDLTNKISKKRNLRECGIKVVDSPALIGDTVKKNLNHE